jgi:DNA polymerase-3 subunit gamma/tau
LGATLKALIERNAQDCLDIIENVFKLGYDPKQFAQDLLVHLRNLMIVKVTGSSERLKDKADNDLLEFLDLPDEEIEELKKFSGNLSEEDVHLLFDMTLKGTTDVVRAQDPRIVLEMLLLRLSQAPRLVAIEKLIGGLQTGSLPVGSASNGASGAKSAPASMKPAAPPSDLSAAHERWSALVENIKRDKPLLGAKLEYAMVQSIESDKLSISFKKEQEYFYQQVAQNDVVQQLMDLVGKHWGRPYKIEVRLAQGSGAVDGAGRAPTHLSPIEAKDKRQAEAESDMRAKVESHPLVKEAKNVLKAKITSIKESK